MPVISVFLGITVRTYFGDHPLPHVHVAYQGFEALIDARTGAVIAGDLPRRPLALVREWLTVRKSDILANWKRAEALQKLERITGLDAD